LPRPSIAFKQALLKRKLIFLLAGAVTLAAALVPIAVMADDQTASQAAGIAADTVWVIVTGCLVMFMQAGFAMLEVGFSRMKNVGTVVAKVVTNLSVSSIAYWAVGFGFAFGAGGWFAFIGGSGFFPTFSPGSQLHLPAIDASTATASAKWFFEFVFCAVSLAIVWGTADSSRPTSARRTSRARQSCTSRAPPRGSPASCCSALASASTRRGGPTRSPDTTCRSRSWAC